MKSNRLWRSAVDFGYTAPQMTLPIGCQATIDCGKRQLVIAEAAVTTRAAATT